MATKLGRAIPNVKKEPARLSTRDCTNEWGLSSPISKPKQTTRLQTRWRNNGRRMQTVAVDNAGVSCPRPSANPPRRASPRAPIGMPRRCHLRGRVAGVAREPPLRPRPAEPIVARKPGHNHRARLVRISAKARQAGTWCSGITSAPHAEGPGFNPQCVHCTKQRSLWCTWHGNW